MCRRQFIGKAATFDRGYVMLEGGVSRDVIDTGDTSKDHAVIMVALCNRADHYIFILFLSSSSFFFLLLYFPRLISEVGDWMFTILWHIVWP